MRRARSLGPSQLGEDTVNEVVERLIDALPPPDASGIGASRTVTAMLPNGRIAWLRLRPTLASVAEANAVARKAEYAAFRNAAAIRRTAWQIHWLAKISSVRWRRLAKGRRSANRDVLQHITQHERKVDKRLAKIKTEGQDELRREWKELQRGVQKVERRGLWERIVLLSSEPLFAAYGQGRDPFATNNLTLWISLLVWLVGDELADWLTGEKTIQGGILADVDVWTYIAPFANVLTGWWLLSDAQQDRFVTGVTGEFQLERSERTPASPDNVDVYAVTVDLSDVVAADFAAEFASYSGVPVVAAVTSSTPNPPLRVVPEVRIVRALVRSGMLEIHVVATIAGPSPSPSPHPGPSPGGGAGGALVSREPLLTGLQVAWIVDTREPRASG